MTAIRTMSLVRNTCLPLPRPVDAGKLWKAENRKIVAPRRSLGADRGTQPGRAGAWVGRNLGVACGHPATSLAECRGARLRLRHVARAGHGVGAVGDEALDDSVFQ